ncbi:MAG: cysteine--tRNA ligase [Candidatus Saccharimonadales bacterium]
MKLYNTLSKQAEELKPLHAATVTIYTCGPTVYDYAHIGHWFTYVRWDSLVRTLKAIGYDPKWVMNITDVGHLVSDADEGEDKLEKGARREGKTAWEVAEFYTKDFLDEMSALNILRPNYLPRATDHISEQIELIRELEKKGYTYIISDGVYYDTSKFPAYADFARLDLEEQEAGKRVHFNPEKRNLADFALWKFSPNDYQRDMEWDSPWGKGFPGWHIECSAMSMKYLGETLDIHTGGIDHIPVHHTNEIAQSEPVTGKPFSNIWLHSNHVLIEGEKISKSLNNGIRLPDIIAKGYDPLVLRLHVLESHYRSQSKFSWESLEAAKNRLQNYRAAAVLRWQPVALGGIPAAWLEPQRTALQVALEEDLGTPEALAELSRIFTAIENSGISTESQAAYETFLDWLDATLGLRLSEAQDITDAQKQLIAEREQVRTNKEWAKSDELRDQLLAQGIALRDTSNGTIWYRL